MREAEGQRRCDGQVMAKAYDNPIPGYKTKTVGNLRLWQAISPTEFDLQKFNEGKYDEARLQARKAADISAVLYPNDATEEGKALRLKQQFFFVSASIQVPRPTLFPFSSGPDPPTHLCLIRSEGRAERACKLECVVQHSNLLCH